MGTEALVQFQDSRKIMAFSCDWTAQLSVLNLFPKPSFLSCVISDTLLVFLFQYLERDIENILIFCQYKLFFMALVDIAQDVAVHVFSFPAATAMNGFVS